MMKLKISVAKLNNLLNIVNSVLLAAAVILLIIVVPSLLW